MLDRTGCRHGAVDRADDARPIGPRCVRSTRRGSRPARRPSTSVRRHGRSGTAAIWPNAGWWRAAGSVVVGVRRAQPRLVPSRLPRRRGGEPLRRRPAIAAAASGSRSGRRWSHAAERAGIWTLEGLHLPRESRQPRAVRGARLPGRRSARALRARWVTAGATSCSSSAAVATNRRARVRARPAR